MKNRASDCRFSKQKELFSSSKPINRSIVATIAMAAKIYIDGCQDLYRCRCGRAKINFWNGFFFSSVETVSRNGTEQKEPSVELFPSSLCLSW